MTTAIHVNLDVGREGIGFGMRRKHLDPIHAVSVAAAESAGPLPCSRANIMCRGIIVEEGQEIRTLAKPRGLHLQLGYLRAKENPEQTDTAAGPCLLPMRVTERLDTKALS